MAQDHVLSPMLQIYSIRIWIRRSVDINYSCTDKAFRRPDRLLMEEHGKGISHHALQSTGSMQRKPIKIANEL